MFRYWTTETRSRCIEPWEARDYTTATRNGASRRAPYRRPWDDREGEISLDEQARCYKALFRAFYHQPWFQGMYWWKVGTNGYGGPQDGTHTPWGNPAMDVVKRWYLSNAR